MESNKFYKVLSEELATKLTPQEVSQFKTKLDEICDKYKAFATITEPNVSFGQLREVFENMSLKLFESPQGRNVIGKYTKTIGKNPDAARLYVLHESIENPKCSKEGAKLAISEALSVIGTVSNDKLKSVKNSLKMAISEGIGVCGGKIVVEDFAQSKRNNVWGAVERLVSEKKNVSNSQNRAEDLKLVTEEMEKNAGKIGIDKGLDSIKESINAFNEKYGGKLDEHTLSIIKPMVEGLSGEKAFNQIKTNCLERMNSFANSKDKELSENAQVLKGKLEKKEYNPQTIAEDMEILYNLQNSLKENKK